jgi:hypothetical protein
MNVALSGVRSFDYRNFIQPMPQQGFGRMQPQQMPGASPVDMALLDNFIRSPAFQAQMFQMARMLASAMQMNNNGGQDLGGMSPQSGAQRPRSQRRTQQVRQNQQERRARDPQNGIDQPNGPNQPTGPGSSTVTGQQLDRHLRGRFAGQGDAIVRAAQRHGVDPRLLASIAIHETGNGNSRGVRNNNNPGGLMDPRTGMRTQQRFPTLEAGFDAMARNLRRNYLDRGLTTIPQIGRKYAPIGAANDPGSLNRHWIPTVSSIYQRLGR